MMLRKKKRPSEREADANEMVLREEFNVIGEPSKRHTSNRRQLEVAKPSTVMQIDLNSDPNHNDMQVDALNMNAHVGAPNYPMQVHMNQNGPNGGQGYFSNGGSFGSNSCQNNPP